MYVLHHLAHVHLMQVESYILWSLDALTMLDRYSMCHAMGYRCALIDVCHLTPHQEIIEHGIAVADDHNILTVEDIDDLIFLDEDLERDRMYGYGGDQSNMLT